jgi:hypothetical protein
MRAVSFHSSLSSKKSIVLIGNITGQQVKHFVFLLAFFQIQLGISAQHKEAKEQYLIAAVNGTEWCSEKEQGKVAIEIDRIVAAGFNTISLGTYKFMPMYFVDYSKTKYPDGQAFDIKKVQQNVSVLRSNMQRAKAKGIKYIISRSYSHYIPYKFWKSRQDVFNRAGIYTRYLQEAHQNDMYLSAVAGKGIEIGHQQWNNPVYKDYFISSTYAMMKALPELDGFLNAYAEAAWTLDESKLKEDKWKNWKDCINYDATNDNFVDYVNTLHKILVDTRGQKAFFGIRDWYVDAKLLAKLSFPLNEFYIAVKYGGYDQPVANYAPWADSLKAQGLGVIHDMLVYDAEHPHPLYWYDNKFIAGIINNIYSAGFPGIQYQDFQIKGDDDADNPIRLLVQQTVGKAIKHEGFERADAVNFLKKYYGEAAGALLRSLELVTQAQQDNIKLKPAWFWQGDGLTPGGLSTERYWMFMDNPEAPKGMAFIRQNIVGVKEYTDAVISGKDALTKAEQLWQKEKRITPMEAMQSMKANAEDAVVAALQARVSAPKNAPHLKELVASAVIHQQLVNRDNAFLQSALDYYESGGQYDGKYNNRQTLLNTRMDRKAECKTHLEKEMYYDLLIKELCLKYMPRRRAVRGTKPYDFTRRIAEIIGQKITTDEKADAVELDRLVAIIENTQK